MLQQASRGEAFDFAYFASPEIDSAIEVLFLAPTSCPHQRSSPEGGRARPARHKSLVARFPVPGGPNPSPQIGLPRGPLNNARLSALRAFWRVERRM
jgi:hypothetical protein